MDHNEETKLPATPAPLAPAAPNQLPSAYRSGASVLTGDTGSGPPTIGGVAATSSGALGNMVPRPTPLPPARPSFQAHPVDGIHRSTSPVFPSIEAKTVTPPASGPVAGIASVSPTREPVASLMRTTSSPTSDGTKAAAGSAGKSLLQQLASHDDKRSAIVDAIRKQDTRGTILVGRGYIKEAERDPDKLAHLKAMRDAAESRDREAIEVACRRAFGTSKGEI